MGKTFKNVTLSVIGEFGPKADKFKQWVEANGGKFSKEVNDQVTHLLSTKEAFKRANTVVRAAKRIKGLKIVSSDWLEDSLLSKSRRPKREGPYLWSHLTKNVKKKCAARQDVNKEPKAGLKNGRYTRLFYGILKLHGYLANNNLPKSGLARKKNSELGGIPLHLSLCGKQYSNDYFFAAGHHVYSDAAGTRYMATLVRPIEASKAKEKHVLKLYESDHTPHIYAVFAKYTRPGRVGSDYITPVGNPLSTALKEFNKFFLGKAGKSWDQREGPPKPKKGQADGKICSWDNWFEYVAEPSTPVTATLNAEA
ncbi:hypothetical protein McanMca71_001091 [Microsporum canis]